MNAPPILCYHKVDARREFGVTRVSPRVFRRQMESLAKAGWRTLGGAELSAHLAAPAPAASPVSPSHASPLTSHSSRLLVLTFDDGYAALAVHAFPVLADLGFRALVFVVTDYVGRDNDWDVHYGWRRFRHLTWDELAHWQERGIEVHSHGATHQRLTWIPDSEAEDELGRSRQAIASRLGVPPAALSYPFGAVDARVRRLTAAAGYTMAVAGPRGLAGQLDRSAGPDPLVLGRLPVYAWDPFAVPLVLRGGAAGACAAGLARAASRLSVATSAIRRVFG